MNWEPANQRARIDRATRTASAAPAAQQPAARHTQKLGVLGTVDARLPTAARSGNALSLETPRVAVQPNRPADLLCFPAIGGMLMEPLARPGIFA
ncbi:hypothetical protein C7I85_02190 [Mesorhizobium soli]|uniref:Uncharacterized protein n=1 Tax=Pseudaminobacter soli (ex Li et al. 2025) TaxID=1295366 RepID=A0A2P7SNB0_9HYPH|nr:hypothetical protein C7I85_02190 [Mesorhizobium soli]